MIWSLLIGFILTFLCHKAIQRKKDNPVIAFIIFIVSIIQIVLLFVLLFNCNNIVATAEEQVRIACDEPAIREPIQNYGQTFIVDDKLTGAQQVEMEYTSLIDKIMCTQICPCKESVREKIIKRGDDSLRLYNRSISIDYMS